MNNKVAGLYVNLAKALNALEEAGEAPAVYSLGVEGISSEVTFSHQAGTWNVGTPKEDRNL